MQQQQQVFLAGQPRLLVPAHQFTLLTGGGAEGGGGARAGQQFATLLSNGGEGGGGAREARGGGAADNYADWDHSATAAQAARATPSLRCGRTRTMEHW